MAPERSAVLPGTVPLDDRRLVESFLAVQAEWAFRELYQRYTPRLFRLLVRLTTDPADADELVQETWLRAARTLPGFSWRSAFGTWLTGIAFNVLRERTRFDIRRPTLLPLEDSSGPRSAPAVSYSGSDIDLERAVAALPPGYRAVLLLHDVEGYTHAEIAEFLDIAPGTSKSQLARARRLLRTRLASDPEDER